MHTSTRYAVKPMLDHITKTAKPIMVAAITTPVFVLILCCVAT